MHAEIFYWVLNMSISASIMGMVIYLLSKIKRIPRRIICLLWGIPFLRMWIPVGLNSQYSLMSLLSKFTTKTVTVYEGEPAVSMMNFVMGAESYFPITYKVDLLEDVFSVAGVVWLIVALALILTTAMLYIAGMAELKDARHRFDRIYISDRVSTPAVYGVFRARIILPRAYDRDSLALILMHENAHIKRRDNLRRIAAMVTACLHWFNPLSWLFLKSFLESVELACDEAVLAKCDDVERRRYAKMLLACTECRSHLASALGGARVRVRIERILSYKKLSVLSMIAFVLLAVLVGCALLTNAK